MSYPRHLNVNFRKLDKLSLVKILKHYGVDQAKNTKTQAELAALVARIFDASFPPEKEVIDNFANHYCYALSDSPRPRTLLSQRYLLDKDHAMIGEQVAAKLSKSGSDTQEGAWILGNVVDYDAKAQTYEIQDEDDISRVMTLPMTCVKRLEGSSTHLRRGEAVMAVFPETTSFYKAIVAKVR